MGNVIMGEIKDIKGKVSPTARLTCTFVVYSPVGHFPEMGGNFYTLHVEALTAYLILASIYSMERC